MIQKHNRICCLVVGLLLLCSVRSYAYLMDGSQMHTVRMLLGAIYASHAKPIQSWDELSEHIHDAYTRAADTKRLFWRSDYGLMLRHVREIDDQLRGPTPTGNAIEGTNLEFLSDYVDIVRERAKESIAILRGFLDANWDYGSIGFYDPRPSRWPAPTNAFGAEKSWETFVKYEVLKAYYEQQSTLSSLAAEDEEDNLELLRELSSSKEREEDFLASEPRNRKKIINKNVKELERLIGESMEEWFNSFLERLVFSHDPHSKLFLAATKVVKPAYSNEFESLPYPKGQIEGYGENEPLQTEGASEVVPSGRVNFALLESLEAQGKKTYGYLGINSFYRNRQATVSQRVQEALVYLDANTSGLVIDLRNNPGGYIVEVVQILGYFIGRKPVLYSFMPQKSAEKMLQQIDQQSSYDSMRRYTNFSSVMTDYYTFMEEATSDQIYAKPLVVLVNERTASGGELMSSVLQDYGRAVVVGSKRTFGKGTGQQLLSFPKTQNNPRIRLNLTGLIYYRVTGKSVQLYGLRSDIVLPSTFYHFGGVFENELFNVIAPFPIETESIPDIEPSFVGVLEQAKANSKERMLNSTYFQYIRGAIQYMEAKASYEQIPLGYRDYMAYQYRNERWRLGLSELQSRLPSVFGAKVDSSEEHKPPESLLRALEKDPYVAEAYEVLAEVAGNLQNAETKGTNDKDDSSDVEEKKGIEKGIDVD